MPAPYMIGSIADITPDLALSVRPSSNIVRERRQFSNYRRMLCSMSSPFILPGTTQCPKCTGNGLVNQLCPHKSCRNPVPLSFQPSPKPAQARPNEAYSHDRQQSRPQLPPIRSIIPPDRFTNEPPTKWDLSANPAVRNPCQRLSPSTRRLPPPVPSYTGKSGKSSYATRRLSKPSSPIELAPYSSERSHQRHKEESRASDKLFHDRGSRSPHRPSSG